ncbi:MAG: GNAT family N-acetyltransferase [Rhizobiaceae bacterium]
MTVVAVRHMTENDDDALEALLRRDRGNLIYSTPSFLAFLREATGARVVVLLAEHAGELVGALAFAIQEAAGVGCIVNSLPWWGSHGSVVMDRSRGDVADIRAALLDAIVDSTRAVDALATTIVLLPAEDSACDDYARVLQPTAFDSRIGQITELPGSPDLDEALLPHFHQKTRNLVRKGLKQGFVEVISDDPWAWTFLFETHAANIAALGGASKPRRHFECIRDRIPPDRRRLSIAMDGDRPVAAMLTLAFNGTIEYLTPAIDVAHRSRQPLSFLIVNGMQHAIEAGARRWNWGGTWHGQPALHHFKAGFGAIDVPYRYLVKASERGLSLFRERRSDLARLFPYFYAYPFAEL